MTRRTPPNPVHFDIDGIDGLIVRLGSASETIADILEELDQKVAILDDNWTGNANLAYRNAHNQWTAALKEFNEALKAVKKLAQAHNSAYDEAETKIAKMFT